MLRAHRPCVSRLPKDRCLRTAQPRKMPARAPCRALSVVLILLWARPPAARACPHPCACYVPSEVHCTFRSLASVPAGISKHVERINLGFNSIQALSETSLAGLSKLELLMLHGNNIASIPDGALRDLGSLQVFKFSYNKLRVLTAQTLRGLRSLVRLHVDHNEIEFIHPHAFRGLTALRLLHLEGNLLRQLHPGAFSTFSLLDHFRLSNIRHLYLADNRLERLPAGMLANMPLLENLYLHGNPWACDCDMRWFLEWQGRSKGILKCKKDKAYEGGQLCATCASPRRLRREEIQKLEDVPCLKPSISSPLRHNGSGGPEDEQGAEGDRDSQLSAQPFQVPPWHVSVNMSDEHGNTVSLACDTQRPTHLSQVRLNQTESQEVELNATVRLDLACPMTRDNYEKLWKLIAYYSEVPVSLHREATLGHEPGLAHEYRQDADADALYYTGVRARVLAEPDWLTQPSIRLQLDRRRSTARTVWLTYSAQLAWSTSPADAGRARGRSWVMVEPGVAGRRALAVLAGAPCQLSCNVKASESPAISWVLPDGLVLTAPAADPEGRVSILTSGWLKIAATRPEDSGLYHCVAQVRDETDRIVYRVLVEPAVPRPPEGQTVTIQQDAGEALTLPCNALATPEAQVSWILPNGRMISDFANSSHAYVLANGTLSIPKLQPSDGGFYRCVAINQLGADHFTVGVSVRTKGPGRSAKRGRRPGGKTASWPRDVVEDEGGSGDDAATTTGRLPPKDPETPVPKKEEAGAGGKKAKKGRRKPKGWKTPVKDAETNVAEGRRVFESRRKVNMANKQITPERWADILARVRGKTLPRSTGGPHVLAATTPPPPGLGPTPVLPALPPPSGAPGQTAAGAEASSADASLFGEEERVFSPVPTTRDRGILAGAKVTSRDPDGLIDDEFPEKADDATRGDGDSEWAAATVRLSVPYDSYSALSTAVPAHGGPSRANAGAEGWPPTDAGPLLASVSREGASGLDLSSWAESEAVPRVPAASELTPQADEDETKGPSPRDATVTPTSPAVDSETPEPLGGAALGDLQVPVETRPQEQTDDLWLAENGLRAQHDVLTTMGTEDNSVREREAGEPGAHAARSPSPETEGPGVASTASPDSSRGAKSTVPGARDKDATAVAVTTPAAKTPPPSPPTTQPPRKRPGGRRRLRPHKSRHQDPQTPPAASAPAGAAPARPTPPPDATVTDRADSSPSSTSGLESTAGPHPRLDVDKHAAAGGRGTMRRKPGKRPHRHRQPGLAAAAASTLGPAAGGTHDGLTAPTAEASVPSRTLPPTTGEPRRRSRVEDYTPPSSERHLSQGALQGTVAVTDMPVSHAKDVEKVGGPDVADDTTGRVATGANSVVNVPSPSGSGTSTAGAFKEESGSLGSQSWVSPRTAQPGTLQTDTAVPTSPETGSGPSAFTDLDDPDPRSDAPPSAAASAPVQQEGHAAVTTISSVNVESSSNRAGSATRHWGHGGTTAAAMRSEIRPQSAAVRPTLHATVRPTTRPTLHAAVRPTTRPTLHAAVRPTTRPTLHAAVRPTVGPTLHAAVRPTVRPTLHATVRPTVRPTLHAAVRPTMGPTLHAAVRPTVRPTLHATVRPTVRPTLHATVRPTLHAAVRPTVRPTLHPTLRPTAPEQPASPFPHSALVSVAPATAKPTPLTPATPPATAASREAVFFNHVGIPRTRTPPGTYEGTPPTQKPPESPNPSTRFDALNLTPKKELDKEASDGGTTNVLPRGPHPQHQPGRVRTIHHVPRVPDQPVPPTWTARPARTTTRHPSRHSVTFQPPRHWTNKPETAAYPSRVWPEHNHLTMPKLPSTATAPVPWPGSRAGPPAHVPGRGTERAQGHSKASGSDGLAEPTQPTSKAPGVGAHPSPAGRTPFVFNRTFSFPQWAATPKPPPATAPAPGTWQRTAHVGPYHRIHPQSVIHVDFGPPAPPALQRPQNGHLLHSTRSPAPFATSAGPASSGFHQSSSKFFSVGGPPASKFWTLGEKPQIVTKFPQTVSIAADSDVLLPCEATGKPKPFVTWTKVSTGALMTPNTRLPRFEVLKNGSFVIRRAQAQDGGRYLCTAKNLHGADRLLVQLSVAAQQPHVVAGHYQDVTVYLGDTIAMECLAKGTPAPHISWIFPDGRVWQAASRAQGRVTLHENRTLSIRDASFADRGVYKCVASNAAGADSLALRLHVAALPPVIQQDTRENISLPPGVSVHVHCSAKAAPLPSLRWVLGDGTHVRPSQFVHGNLFVFPNGTLYIRNLAPKDSGRYECVAANLVGAARRTVQLSVQRAAANARITGSSPRRTDVRYGGTLRLDCSASGDPWPRILWRLPSKRMIDALFSFDPRVRAFANGTLVVTSVTDKDAGDYLCVARNQVGDDFVVLQVHVVMKPAKIEHKEAHDHSVLYGADLRVDCVASGLPDPEIVWGLPDGSLVQSFVQSDDGGGGGRGQRYVVFHNGTLYFNEVGMREAGDYTCFAKNQVGRDEMTVHVKVVAEPAAIRNKTYAVVHVPYGDVVTVTCEAKGEPTPRVTWLSPTNKPIPTSSDKYQVYEDGTLLIQKAQRADSGNYTCVVRNGAGEDRKVVWVHVQVRPPKINGHPDAITTVREIAAGGSRKLIDCLAEGVPPPRVLWAFPEGVVLPAPYYGHRVTVHRNGTLDIKSLRKSDSVQLACIGRNEGGEARLIVHLTVLEPMEKPFFHDPVTQAITATAGHTISLNCSAAGSPPPTLRWVLPNGTELAGGRQLRRFYHQSDGRLHVSGLSPADAGAYRCVARNAAGHSERLVSLKVGPRTAAASGPQHSVVSILNADTLRLPCPPPPGRPARVSWTLPSGALLHGPQARGRVSVGDNGTLTVREASVFDRGTYVCQADGASGPAAASYAVIVIAYPPRITSEPTPVIYARPGHSVTMKCMAVGVPKAEITWELPDRSQLTVGSQARLYGHRQLHPQGTLTIQQATPSDAGFYKCTAKNILGRDSKTTYIHIY